MMLGKIRLRYEVSEEEIIMSAGYFKDPDAIARLSDEVRVTQESGTERPGTGKLLYNKEPGIYVDIVSSEPLFASSDKYEADAGGPFYQTD